MLLFNVQRAQTFINNNLALYHLTRLEVQQACLSRRNTHLGHRQCGGNSRRSRRCGYGRIVKQNGDLRILDPTLVWIDAARLGFVRIYVLKNNFLNIVYIRHFETLISQHPIGIGTFERAWVSRTNARRKIDGRMLELPAVCLMILSR